LEEQRGNSELMAEGMRSSARKFFQLWALCALPVFFIGCSDELSEANSVGNQFIASNVEIRRDTLQAIRSTTFKQFLAMDDRINLLGKTGNYEAFSVFQFQFPQRDTILVLSAKLTLRAVTWCGDSASSFGFTLHKITRAWSSGTLQWDSVQSGFYESAPVGNPYLGTVESDTQFVVVSLDTAMVRQWLQPNTFTQYGLILLPTATTNVVRGFNAFQFDSTQYYPTVEIIAGNSAGISLDTTKYSSGLDTFVGNIDNLNSNPELMYVQSGVVYRSTLTFDVTSIPTGAIINSAEMLLELNPATSKITKFTGDEVVVAHLLTSSTSNTVFESLGTLGRKDATSNEFMFEARRATQLWVNGINNGFLLRTTTASEFNSFDLYTFHNETAADAALRPRLIVVYTTEKK
jgi:hypothetical protein